jgi:hypothetical protein
MSGTPPERPPARDPRDPGAPVTWPMVALVAVLMATVVAIVYLTTR